MLNKIMAAAFCACLCVFFCAGARGEDKNAKIIVLTDGVPCTISVDGKEIGQSPISWWVVPGTHEITSVDDSGQKKQKEIEAVAEGSVLVKFDYPLPKPVQNALDDGETEMSEGSSWRALSLSVAGVCFIGGSIVVAANWGDDSASGGLSEVTVDQSTITVSVKTNMDAADGDRIDILLNGSIVLDDYELTTADHAVNLNLQSGLNIVDIQAQNFGSEPPNTGVITISDVTEGKSTQQWSVPAGATARLKVNAP